MKKCLTYRCKKQNYFSSLFLFKKRPNKVCISKQKFTDDFDSAEHSGNALYSETSHVVGKSATRRTHSYYTIFNWLFTLRWTSNHRRSRRSGAGSLNINALSPLTSRAAPGSLIRRNKTANVGDKDVGEIVEREAVSAETFPRFSPHYYYYWEGNEHLLKLRRTLAHATARSHPLTSLRLPEK